MTNPKLVLFCGMSSIVTARLFDCFFVCLCACCVERLSEFCCIQVNSMQVQSQQHRRQQQQIQQQQQRYNAHNKNYTSNNYNNLDNVTFI